MTKRPDPRLGQSGQMLAFFAIVLIGLMWVMALGIDSAQLMLRHRQMQSVADLAALAGARSIAEGTTDASSRACAVVIANGYTCPGQATVSFPLPTQIEVNLGAPVDTFFLRVFGITTIDADTRARAMAAPSTGNSYAIFAGCASSSGGTSCTDNSKAIDWSGSDGLILGEYHSNGGVSVGGGGNKIVGESSASRTFSKGGGSNLYTPAPVSNVPREPWPVTYTVADFCPGGSISGSKSFSGVVTAGVYCYTGTINVSNGNVSGNVTFVANKIEISGSDFRFTAHTHNVQFFATGTGDSVIKLSGSDGSWTGLIYAPRGQIEISGQNNTGTVGAGIVGDRIKFNGSDLTVDASGGPPAGGPSQIRLIQ